MNSFQLKAAVAITYVTVLINSAAYAQKWDKYLDKSEAQYEKGDYGSAKKTLDKFKKKVTKKLGVNNQYMPDYFLRTAKYNLALGYLSEFENYIDESLKASAAINGDESVAAGLNQVGISKVMAHYGNYVLARKYLDEALAILKNTDAYDDNMHAKTDLILAQILTGQGYYIESLKFIETNLEHFRTRAVTKESYVDEQGKLKTRRLTEEEVKERLEDYATLLTLKSNTLRQKGNFKSADSAFVRSEVWIASNLTNRSLYYVNNQFLHGKLLVENGLDVENMPRETRFDKSLINLKKDHEESHYLAFELYETLLKQYLYTNERSKYKNVKLEYEKAIKKNFKKTSLHYINLETIEFDAKLTKDKTTNIGTQASTILATTRALPANHEKRISLLEFLYKLDIQKQQFANAEKTLLEIIEIKKNLYGEDAPVYHLTKLQLADYYLDYTDKIKEAEEICQKSFFDTVEKEIDPWHKDYVNILNHLSAYYESTDKYKLASEMLDKALNASREKYDNQDPDYGVELNEIAKLQIKLGNYDKAQTYINDAVLILEKESKNEFRVVDYVGALETQAKLYAIQGLFDDAESNISSSRKLLKRAEATVIYNELAAAEDLSSLYITLGKFSATEDLLAGLITTYQKRYGKTSRRLLTPLVNKGRLQLINGDYPEAEKTALNAKSIAVNTFGDKSSKVAPSLLLLSEIYTSFGDYDKAETNIKNAIAIQQVQFGRDHVDVGKSLTQLGIIKFHKGDNLKEVEGIMDEAKGIIVAKLGNRNPTYASLLTDLAKIYISGKKYDEAFNALALAENIWIAKVGKRNNINLAAIHTLTGDIYYLQRNFDLAEVSYEKSKKLYEKFFNRNHPEYVKILSKLSKVYYMEGDTKRSLVNIEEALANYQNFIKDYFPALSEREKAKFWNTIKADYEFYNTLAFRLMNDNQKIVGNVFNNALLTKAILLNSSIKIRERILNSNDEDLKIKYNNWLEKKEQLTNVISMSIEQLQVNQIDPVALSAEVERLEKELSQKSELFSQSFEDKKIVWNNVRTALKPNEVAIEMVRYRHFDHVFTDSVVYAAIYVKNAKDHALPEVVLINNGAELENRYFRNYRNSIIFRLPDTYSYEKYWAPLQSVVGPYATIYLSADGVYNQINLEAIPTGDGKYVIDKSNIILVSNTKDIYLRQIKTQLVQQEKRASMFGNPNFYLTASSGDINSLPGTQKELTELKDLLKTKGWITNSYTEKDASEDQIKKLDNPKIFHIATHGFFSPKKELNASEELTLSESEASQNPLLRTGLLLTGAGDLLNKTSFNYNLESGILTAYEAMNLNLDQTDLVVLSACETGLGELAVGEGVYGLQRAFLVAGAKTLIMSMFKVDDDATQKLMIKFYKKWLETGNKRASFVEAKKELRTEYSDPIFWGSFIMIGLD
jgi:hypothetical protein